MKNYIKLARVHHYIKNFFIFLPLFFAKQLFNISLLTKSICGFIAFSVMSSAIYVINDLHDVEKDRNHPRKCMRPIAAGAIQKKHAMIFAVVLLAISIIFSIPACNANPSGHIFMLLYFILNLIYSFGAKNVPIVDIAILASGFLLRLLYGSAITNIEISGWLYLTVIAISFYLGLGKRRNEIQLGGDTRAVLRFYTYEFLDKMMYMFMAIAIVFYSLWCVDPITASRFTNDGIIWTVPVIILICMRYSLIIEGASSGDPVEVILKDKIILSLIAIYALIISLIMYL